MSLTLVLVGHDINTKHTKTKIFLAEVNRMCTGQVAFKKALL